MAITTVIDQIDGDSKEKNAAPTPIAPRRGRPPGSANRRPLVLDHEDGPPADATDVEVDAGPEPSRSDDFWMKLSNYTPADWESMLAYLYRTAPSIDRRSGGRPVHLRKYARPFD